MKQILKKQTRKSIAILLAFVMCVMIVPSYAKAGTEGTDVANVQDISELTGTHAVTATKDGVTFLGTAENATNNAVRMKVKTSGITNTIFFLSNGTENIDISGYRLFVRTDDMVILDGDSRTIAYESGFSQLS